MEGYKYGFSDDVTPKLQFDEGGIHITHDI